jgi:hypothetical protein
LSSRSLLIVFVNWNSEVILWRAFSLDLMLAVDIMLDFVESLCVNYLVFALLLLSRVLSMRSAYSCSDREAIAYDVSFWGFKLSFPVRSVI